MKTTNEQYQLIEQYIFDCMNFDDYGINPETKQDKINALIQIFESEYLSPYELKKHNNSKIAAFAEWSKGAPSTFNITQWYDEQIEFGNKWGFDLSTENKQERFKKYWYLMIAESVFYLYYKLNKKQKATV